MVLRAALVADFVDSLGARHRLPSGRSSAACSVTVTVTVTIAITIAIGGSGPGAIFADGIEGVG